MDTRIKYHNVTYSAFILGFQDQGSCSPIKRIIVIKGLVGRTQGLKNFTMHLQVRCERDWYHCYKDYS